MFLSFHIVKGFHYRKWHRRFGLSYFIQAPQRTGGSTKPDRTEEVFGQCSQAHGVTPGNGPVQGWELGSMILVGPFQWEHPVMVLDQSLARCGVPTAPLPVVLPGPHRAPLGHRQRYRLFIA